MIPQIELAMLARIRETGPALGITWHTTHSFPEEFEAYLATNVAIQCPAAWVVFAGWDDAVQLDDDTLRIVGGRFALMVADENKRPDEQYQRHGHPGRPDEPGSYKLLLAAVASLTGQTLGLDLFTPLACGPVRPVAPTVETGKRRWSRFSALFSCDFPLALAPDGESDPAELLKLHANWDIPPFDDPIPIDRDPGLPGRQLPDDAHADATDVLSLGEE